MPDQQQISPGCAQVVATGDATPDGHLYHARILDWSKVQFVIEHPTIFVREPADGIAHVTIGFPGNVSPYQGMNMEGVVVASNEDHARDNSVHDMTGRSHVQLVAQLLAKAHSFEEAKAMILEVDSMSLETLVVSDGKARTGAVFEMAPGHVGVRPIEDGVVFETNHFVAPETADLDADPPAEHTTLRFDRLGQLVPRAGADSKYGSFDPTALVALMRDRVDPYEGTESGAEVFDNGKSLATDGALYEVVFDPEALRFWVAAGSIPVPAQPFTGFSLEQMVENHVVQDPPDTIP
jgi:hypothetical protein